jgi:phage shock protein E
VKDRLFLDVRSPQEFLGNGLEDSLNIPHDMIMNNLQYIPDDREVLIYCRSGKRAGIITKVLKQLGYDVKNIGTVERAEDILIWKR